MGVEGDYHRTCLLTVFSALSVRDRLAGDLSLRGLTTLLKVRGDKSHFLAFFSVLVGVRDCRGVRSSKSSQKNGR